MIIQLKNVVDAGTLEAVRDSIKEEDFLSGTHSAGRAAREVKNNQQIRYKDSQHSAIKLLLSALQRHPVVAQAAQPKVIINPMLNRYTPGQAYGWHTDDAIMDGQRTDISFTLGLTPLDDYEGGELVLQDHSGDRAWRLGAGELLLYPSHYLHQVTEVTQGQRLALVGWMQSRLRESWQREICFDLALAGRTEYDQNGKSAQFDRLSNALQNLLRHWVD
ncbi:Fe2+-dependent dioxygenase [Saliniradius amylolyticus]|nr:Fe2+-dependent dioxygenase [Saliniradius amylolyticus]